MLILFTACITWAWYSYVLNISENYLFQNPDFEVHKFMPTLQVVLVSVFFIAHFVLALIDFLNRYWYWGLWLVVVPIIVGRSIFPSLERLRILIVYQSGLTIHFAC
ncbi:hypothetical protein [Acinetobacter amyesii]|uniref:hypothetical protein n=1 Tax=Acinetobacter amyesii TaxID=2942470 RepID=UPI0020BDE1EE|nr:hypothetical protein [Acinetobacter amyesii]MCL6241264.1 hypothetical protein [Acinetobacter amyesii]